MIWDLFTLIVLATSPILTKVIKNPVYSCSLDEFSCSDGACISFDLQCDGHADCADGSDEVACYNSPQHQVEEQQWESKLSDGHKFIYAVRIYKLLNDIPFGDPKVSRIKRQTSKCGRNRWQCRDGTCINFDGKCDGVVDCPDRSDETHALCRKTQCQQNWFRCTYGACVDGTAPCNEQQDCADNSDELLPRCRNETDEVRGQYKCQNGDTIPAANHCDGVADCADGSDETVRACSAKICPTYLFQCAYGACVDQGSDCNGKQECADNSDEADELCNRIAPPGPIPTPTSKPPQSGNCVLPPYPDHGRYIVAGAPNASPGQGFYTVQLNVTCNPGYGVNGDSSLYCIDGSWSVQNFPQCVRFCRLNKHPSVDYRCLISGSNSVEGSRDCNDQEPTGTIVKPQCKAPNYYYSGTLNYMRCIDGSWDYVAICTPECGRITPGGMQLVIGGRLAQRGELPWHTGIYRKTTTPYMQICGGTLVSTTVVISAAHCFWDNVEEKAQPASMFAVAFGKLYRPWNNPKDADAQKSDVSDIKIPVRFQGAAANFQEDIAIMLLVTPVVYKTYVRPVCIDFEPNFDKKQLTNGNIGKVAGWGLTAENGNASQVLRVVELPYVDIGVCIAESPPGFREYITPDKICAGYRNGTALCKGDSGGGLVFPEPDRGTERYYLRGIVSTAPNNDNACNAFTWTSFTQITKHEHFIKEYLFF